MRYVILEKMQDKSYRVRTVTNLRDSLSKKVLVGWLGDNENGYFPHIYIRTDKQVRKGQFCNPRKLLDI